MMWELFQVFLIPFGFNNAPPRFVNMMNDLVGDYFAQFALILLDDVLLCFANDKEHAKHLEKVLQVLMMYEIYLRASKYEIYWSSADFLDQQTWRRDSSNKGRVEGGLWLLQSTEFRDFRQFLGFAGCSK